MKTLGIHIKIGTPRAVRTRLASFKFGRQYTREHLVGGEGGKAPRGKKRGLKVLITKHENNLTKPPKKSCFKKG